MPRGDVGPDGKYGKRLEGQPRGRLLGRDRQVGAGLQCLVDQLWRFFPDGRQRVVRVQGRQERSQDIGERRSGSGDVDVLQATGGQGCRHLRRRIGPPGQVSRDGDELTTRSGQDQTSTGSGEQGDPQAPLEQVQLT